MSAVSFRQADLPGTRPLYADLLVDFASVRRFYGRPPSLESARAAAAEIRIEPVHRSRLADELGRQNAGGDAATLSSIDRLSQPGTVVVATGQQVGLLGGPVFTLYKALTAVRCARELTRSGTPAVPVFWLATEDHDLEEVNHAWAFGPAGEPHRIRASTAGESGAAVGDIRIEDAKLDELETVCAGLPYAQDALAIARGAYAAAPRFGESFRSLYRDVLAGSGIVFLCPMREGIRTLAAPVVRRAIERAPELTDALLRRGSGLLEAGYHQQVRVQDSTSLVLLFEGAERVSLQRRNGYYWARSQAYSREDLLRRLERSPLDVSPSALLRPVMQDFLLPTAALVAGPSEAAYLAQSSVLYEALLGRMPAVLPRASFTVLDGATRKLMKKYGLSLADCLVPRRDVEEAVAAAVVPPPLRDSLATGRSGVEGALQGIQEAIRGFDPTLAGSFAVSRKKIAYQLAKTEAKVSREALRRAATARRHAAALADTVYPHGVLQERVYALLPFLARFGPSLAERVRDEIAPGCADHRVLDL